MLPLKQAVRLPILVGKKVQLIDLNRGKIDVVDKCPKTFSIRLGVGSKYSIYPPKREISMLRFAEGGHLNFCSENDKIDDIRVLSGFSISIRGCLSIYDDVVINQHCTIYCDYSITIKNHVGIGWNTQILDSDIHFIYNTDTHSIANCFKDIIVCENVWIGNSCTIAKGAVIPKFSIVASHSLVNKDFGEIETEGNLFVGNPAILKKYGLYRVMNHTKELELKSYFRRNPNHYDIKCDGNILTYCIGRNQ